MQHQDLQRGHATRRDLRDLCRALGAVELEATATIHVDKTAPVITGALPARPPDHDGWWTDPVDFTFTASDLASGVAGCDTVTYAGPEGRGVRVAGGCRDVAGTSGEHHQLLNYDATRGPGWGD